MKQTEHTNEIDAAQLAVELSDASSLFEQPEIVEPETKPEDIPAPVDIPKKRGRKPGQKNGTGKAAKKKAETPEAPEVTEDKADEISEAELIGSLSEGFDASQYEKIELPPEKQQPEYKALISGYVILMGMNLIFPPLVLNLIKRFYAPARVVDVSDVQLDEKELAVLEKAADEVAMMIFTKLSPVSQLLIGFTVMTAAKVMFAIQVKK